MAKEKLIAPENEGENKDYFTPVEDAPDKKGFNVLDGYTDSFLVETLRSRGYTVSCTKTVSL